METKMGILGMLHKHRERKALQAPLGPEILAKLVGETRRPEEHHVEAKHFQFVMILIDETSPEEIPAIIAKVVGTLVEKHVTLSNISSSLLVGLLGVPFPEADSPEARLELVAALLRENAERIRIAHGQCEGAFGILGAKGRWTYGEVIPGFSGILKKLLETKFGTAVEIP
jgi:hypothetical protein